MCAETKQGHTNLPTGLRLSVDLRVTTSNVPSHASFVCCFFGSIRVPLNTFKSRPQHDFFLNCMLLFADDFSTILQDLVQV